MERVNNIPVGRTMIINFQDEEECARYISCYKELIPTFTNLGALEIAFVKASSSSILIFAVIDSQENADKIISTSSQWRKKQNFKVVDTIVFDGEIIEIVNNNLKNIE